jgi:hypothetical protein
LKDKKNLSYHQGIRREVNDSVSGYGVYKEFVKRVCTRSLRSQGASWSKDEETGIA